MSDNTDTCLKTPLYHQHTGHRAKMVPFGGWLMPVSYESVLAEHKTVRERVGIFDVSHMGEVRVKGPDAVKFLQWLTINDITKLQDGGGQYSALLNERGGMIDDLIIYRLASDDFFICVNASNTTKDFDWIKLKSAAYQVNVTNESNLWAQIAVQGPNSQLTLLPLMSNCVAAFKELPYTSILRTTIFGKQCLVARTGYTGEWGYELYIPAEIASNTWMALIERSAETGAKPIGLGARDTLRLESCYLLYGNDMNDDVSPLEAGIGWATKLEKGDFIGRDALLKQKADGIKRRMVAFKMTEDGIPRHGMKVTTTTGKTGEVTSGSVLPTLGGAGGLALVDSSLVEGDSIMIDIRGKPKNAVIVKKPLYTARAK